MIEQIQHLLEGAFRQDTVGLYFLMFSGGLFASVTPCTYPVLPLTIGFIGNQAGANRLRAFLLSLSLVTGLAAVYAVLGASWRQWEGRSVRSWVTVRFFMRSPCIT
jgi:cytochrome c-type biogenesis protein